ncbi:hypothetical protein W97_05571 [Coniosporium apollinis CBS 100218]|uniref:Clr5 domain-containing protein n=1 Tax=Coniosporium apollinis (strain CBS 100218) TaxID=1168221 RepID=R7YXA1_CONA1|nr:uncharacterized protein W97_05571 [Coniosporium apollinis CBS 100218]EON66473.1 hypothetical protein W97_05571 [Coniosporium apollinis CBS 100218]
MPPQHPLQWKGPPVPRAKPITASKWEEHREELCEFYQKMTLDDLMAMMKVRHGFEPSRRQYVFQFEKWGVHKYNTTSKEPARSEYLPVSLPRPSGPTAHHVVEDDDSLQTSIVQTCPRIRKQSSCQKPAVPPKKRQKLSGFISSKDPYADLGLVFNTPGESQPGPGDTVPAAPTAMPLGGTASRIANGGADVVASMPELLIEESRSTISNCAHDADRDLPLSETGSDWDDSDRDIREQLSTGQASGRERLIDSSRPIDTFSRNEIQDMKHAADFLYSLLSDEDAFPLYVLVLKRLKQSNQPVWMMSSAIIACARSATTSSQVEIARSLLEQKLQDPQGSATDAEIFLFRMLLAYTYIRCGDDFTASFHIETAMGFNLSNENLFMQLREEDRSLDIITYPFLAQYLGCLGDLGKAKTLGRVAQDKLVVDKSLIRRRLREAILERAPGPFELKHGSMGNPCMRSCLQWCTSEIRCTVKIPGSWKSLHSHRRYERQADYIGLFCCLWERWQTRRTEFPAEQLPLMRQADKLMGISAAELLISMCRMIMHAAPARLDNSEWDLLLRARIGAMSLSQQSDEQLGLQYLDLFSRMMTLRSSNDPVLDMFMKAARVYQAELITKNLMIMLPDVQNFVSDSESGDPSDEFVKSNTPTRSLSIVAAVLLPTLAPSLDSSDLSSLRLLKDRIQQDMRGAARDAAMRLPSTAFRNSSRSMLDLPSMSELSQAMASSLSLSSVRQAGTTALEALVTVSSNVRERVADMEESSLRKRSLFSID